MEQVKLPFRADIVGSFLRPERLKKARKTSNQAYYLLPHSNKSEDEEIEKLIADKKIVGLQVITDGEFRRSWWHLDFFWGLGGIEKKAVGQGYVFHNLETRPESVKVTGKITGYNHPMIAHFRFHPETGWPGDTQANDSFSGTTFGRVDPRGKYG